MKAEKKHFKKTIEFGVVRFIYNEKEKGTLVLEQTRKRFSLFFIATKYSEKEFISTNILKESIETAYNKGVLQDILEKTLNSKDKQKIFIETLNSALVDENSYEQEDGLNTTENLEILSKPTLELNKKEEAAKNYLKASLANIRKLNLNLKLSRVKNKVDEIENRIKNGETFEEIWQKDEQMKDLFVFLLLGDKRELKNIGLNLVKRKAARNSNLVIDKEKTIEKIIQLQSKGLYGKEIFKEVGFTSYQRFVIFCRENGIILSKTIKTIAIDKEEAIKKINQLLREGFYGKEIFKEVGFTSYSALSVFCRENGISLRARNKEVERNRTRKSRENVYYIDRKEEMISMLEEGKGIGEISKEFGITRQAVSFSLKSLGVNLGEIVRKAKVRILGEKIEMSDIDNLLLQGLGELEIIRKLKRKVNFVNKKYLDKMISDKTGESNFIDYKASFIKKLHREIEEDFLNGKKAGDIAVRYGVTEDVINAFIARKTLVSFKKKSGVKGEEKKEKIKHVLDLIKEGKSVKEIAEEYGETDGATRVFIKVNYGDTYPVLKLKLLGKEITSKAVNAKVSTLEKMTSIESLIKEGKGVYYIYRELDFKSQEAVHTFIKDKFGKTFEQLKSEITQNNR